MERWCWCRRGGESRRRSSGCRNRRGGLVRRASRSAPLVSSCLAADIGSGFLYALAAVITANATATIRALRAISSLRSPLGYPSPTFWQTHGLVRSVCESRDRDCSGRRSWRAPRRRLQPDSAAARSPRLLPASGEVDQRCRHEERRRTESEPGRETTGAVTSPAAAPRNNRSPANDGRHAERRLRTGNPLRAAAAPGRGTAVVLSW